MAAAAAVAATAAAANGGRRRVAVSQLLARLLACLFVRSLARLPSSGPIDWSLIVSGERERWRLWRRRLLQRRRRRRRSLLIYARARAYVCGVNDARFCCCGNAPGYTAKCAYSWAKIADKMARAKRYERSKKKKLLILNVLALSTRARNRTSTNHVVARATATATSLAACALVDWESESTRTRAHTHTLAACKRH